MKTYEFTYTALIKASTEEEAMEKFHQGAFHGDAKLKINIVIEENTECCGNSCGCHP